MLRYCMAIGLLLITLISVPGNVSAQKTPLELNDYLAGITDSLNFYGREWGAEVKEAFESKDFKSIVPKRQKLETYIDRQISVLTRMKDIKNSKKLRETMIGFLNFEKTAIVGAMKPFEKMGANTESTEQDNAITVLTDNSKKEEAELQKVYEEQVAYAKANGFPLEGKSEEAE